MIGCGADLILTPIDLDEGIGSDLRALEVDGVVVGGNVEIIADSHQSMMNKENGKDVEGRDEEERNDNVPNRRGCHRNQVVTLEIFWSSTNGDTKEFVLEELEFVGELIEDDLSSVLVGEKEVKKGRVILLVLFVGAGGSADVFADGKPNIGQIRIKHVDTCVAVVSVAVVLNPLPVVPKHPTAPQSAEVVDERFRGESVVT